MYNYLSRTGKQPLYLHYLITPALVQLLLPSSSNLLFKPKGNTSIGNRAFTVGVPTFLNMLPSSVKPVENIAIFHSQLKTYLYNLAYPP